MRNWRGWPEEPAPDPLRIPRWWGWFIYGVTLIALVVVALMAAGRV